MSSFIKNLDHAFPPFAPGLPSVYERAGFDVNPSVHTRDRSPSLRSIGCHFGTPKSGSTWSLSTMEAAKAGPEASTSLVLGFPPTPRSRTPSAFSQDERVGRTGGPSTSSSSLESKSGSVHPLASSQSLPEIPTRSTKRESRVVGLGLSSESHDNIAASRESTVMPAIDNGSKASSESVYSALEAPEDVKRKFGLADDDFAPQTHGAYTPIRKQPSAYAMPSPPQPLSEPMAIPEYREPEPEPFGPGSPDELDFGDGDEQRKFHHGSSQHSKSLHSTSSISASELESMANENVPEEMPTLREPIEISEPVNPAGEADRSIPMADTTQNTTQSTYGRIVTPADSMDLSNFSMTPGKQSANSSLSSFEFSEKAPYAPPKIATQNNSISNTPSPMADMLAVPNYTQNRLSTTSSIYSKVADEPVEEPDVGDLSFDEPVAPLRHRNVSVPPEEAKEPEQMPYGTKQIPYGSAPIDSAPNGSAPNNSASKQIPYGSEPAQIPYGTEPKQVPYGSPKPGQGQMPYGSAPTGYRPPQMPGMGMPRPMSPGMPRPMSPQATGMSNMSGMSGMPRPMSPQVTGMSGMSGMPGMPRPMSPQVGGMPRPMSPAFMGMPRSASQPSLQGVPSAGGPRKGNKVPPAHSMGKSDMFGMDMSTGPTHYRPPRQLGSPAPMPPQAGPMPGRAPMQLPQLQTQRLRKKPSIPMPSQMGSGSDSQFFSPISPMSPRLASPMTMHQPMQQMPSQMQQMPSQMQQMPSQMPGMPSHMQQQLQQMHRPAHRQPPYPVSPHMDTPRQLSPLPDEFPPLPQPQRQQAPLSQPQRQQPQQPQQQRQVPQSQSVQPPSNQTQAQAPSQSQTQVRPSGPYAPALRAQDPWNASPAMATPIGAAGREQDVRASNQSGWTREQKDLLAEELHTAAPSVFADRPVAVPSEVIRSLGTAKTEVVESGPMSAGPMSAGPNSTFLAPASNESLNFDDAPRAKPGKKVCRGCEDVIEGKSIRSKDGNLSGRWHRECFCCTRCADALDRDVYVKNDNPFCQKCYHVVNKSVCRMCGGGVEGTCLETRSEGNDGTATLYHSDCLRCVECQVQLSQSYFEVDGATYCAEHAFSSLPPDAKMQARFTRFIMI